LPTFTAEISIILSPTGIVRPITSSIGACEATGFSELEKSGLPISASNQKHSFGLAFDQRVVFHAAARLQPEVGATPERLVIHIRHRRTRAVARKTGDAAVGVYDLAKIIGRFAIQLFKHRDAVAADAGVPMADRHGKIGHVHLVRDLPLFDHDVIVSKAVEFAEWYGHNKKVAYFRAAAGIIFSVSVSVPRFMMISYSMSGFMPLMASV
jgi:hypothetical protein